MKKKKGRNLEEMSCLYSLRNKHDIRIHSDKRIIWVLRGPASTMDLGNKSWGKIDYLASLGYRVEQVDEFPQSPKNRDERETLKIE
jgi:hypothetical protein